jgi:hypothetical protein
MKTNLSVNHCIIKAILFFLVLFFTGNHICAQNKIYANSQTNQISGICLGCNVENPQNAVGSNENDYSTLKIGIGVVGKVEQTLAFPSPTTKKFIIGIGTSNIPLTVSLLQGVSVETFNGDISNNDLQFIDSSILKLGTQTNKATIELQPTKMYDRIKISLHGGLLNLSGGLQVYYAYNPLPSICNPSVLSSIPLPIHYYSFNGNTNDLMAHLNLSSSHPQEFQNNMICNQGIASSSPDLIYSLKGNSLLNVPSPRAPRTVSFWAQVEQGGTINLTIYGEKIKITQDSIIIKPVNENNRFNKTYFGRMFRKNPATPGTFNFYVINFNNDPTPPYSVNNNIYLPNDKTDPPYYSVDLRITVNSEGLTGPFNLFNNSNILSTYPTSIQTTHWAPYYTKGPDLSNNEFIISFNASQIDELFIYDGKMAPEELLNAYSQSATNDSTVNKALTSTENVIFTISPNPTTGQITLNGNIFLTDAEISITNTSGSEVYYSKFRSKTFDLPPTLPGGVYILTVNTKDGKIYSRKIILTR